MKKINFISLKFRLHGEYSGYDQLIKHVNHHRNFTMNSLEKDSLFRNSIKKIFDKLIGSYRFLIELKVLFYSLGKEEIFHYIYGENQYKFFGKFKGKNKVICTFHQPKEYFIKINRKNLLKSFQHIDHIIVVSKAMVEFFEDLIGKGNVSYIAHGVDSFFQNDTDIEKNIDILLVGNWLRDFNYANKALSVLSNNKKDISITVLTYKENFQYFKDLKNVTLLNNISDEELKKLYLKSKLQFLPLIDATANNALLEGIASGLPVAMNKLDNSDGYLTEDLRIELDINPEIAGKQLLENLNNPEKLSDLSQRVRDYSKHYLWDSINKELNELYKRL